MLINVKYFIIIRVGADSNPDSDSRQKGWIRIRAKRGEFGFEVPGFAHHWFNGLIQDSVRILDVLHTSK